MNVTPHAPNVGQFHVTKSRLDDILWRQAVGPRGRASYRFRPWRNRPPRAPLLAGPCPEGRVGEVIHQRRIGVSAGDRCPRCHDVRQVIRLAQIDSEPDLLRLYAAMVAGKHVLIEEKLDAALYETDQAKRLAGLQHIVEHRASRDAIPSRRRFGHPEVGG